jgi:hypothetical protein
MLGLVADNEDTQHTGAPEFPVAVRTQLLVGEASYALQDQPAYATAFTKMGDADEDVCVKVGCSRGSVLEGVCRWVGWWGRQERRSESVSRNPVEQVG